MYAVFERTQERITCADRIAAGYRGQWREGVTLTALPFGRDARAAGGRTGPTSGKDEEGAMNCTGYLHDTSHAVIAGALRAAAARGITCQATLIEIVDESSPFNPCDHRARRIWHDELRQQIREHRRPSPVERCEG